MHAQHARNFAFLRRARRHHFYNRPAARKSAPGSTTACSFRMSCWRRVQHGLETCPQAAFANGTIRRHPRRTARPRSRGTCHLRNVYWCTKIAVTRPSTRWRHDRVNRSHDVRNIPGTFRRVSADLAGPFIGRDACVRRRRAMKETARSNEEETCRRPATRTACRRRPIYLDPHGALSR